MVALRRARKAREGLRSEAQVQAAIRLAVGGLPDVRVMRNNTGALKDANGRPVQFGLALGSSDLVCIVAPLGRMLVIEVKKEGWVPAKSGGKGSRFEHEESQRRWIRIVERFGGVGGFALSVDEAMALVERARENPQPKTAESE